MATLPDPLSVFGEDGLLAAAHPRFELREAQVRMAEAVGRRMGEGGPLVVEAGTGTGKTLAYLVPALACRRRVVVSTGTRALQDQLYQRDLPFLAEALDRPVRAACLKGRSNYLCLHRLEEEERTPELFGEDRDRLARILSWSRRTDTGDVAELEDLPEGLELWDRINARSETCLGRECSAYEDCWLYTARERAQEADVVVVNHHLLLADLAVRASPFGRLLPDYEVLVVDEAHRLEDTATHCFAISISLRRVLELVGDSLRHASRPEGEIPDLAEAARELRERGESFFRLLPRESGRRTIDLERMRGPAHGELRDALSALRETARGVSGEEAEALHRRAGTLDGELAAALEPAEDRVTYAEVRGRWRALICAPIRVGGILAEHLWAPLHAGVLTSATLSVGGSTAWIRERLGLEAAEELLLPSPFDTEGQSLLYVADDLPVPSKPEFLDAACERMAELVRASRGRAFLLFTSHANLRGAAERLRGRLGDHPMLVQGRAQKHALLETFREAGDAVLLATASFWEGVDVPGEALSLVVVDKLPFASPGDPVTAARIASVREAGGNPFTDHQVPEAILSLKQGLGRLLRSREDRGVLAVLDVRLRSRPYGKTFLDSLPPCPRTRDLGEVRRFFDR